MQIRKDDEGHTKDDCAREQQEVSLAVLSERGDRHGAGQRAQRRGAEEKPESRRSQSQIVLGEDGKQVDVGHTEEAVEEGEPDEAGEQSAPLDINDPACHLLRETLSRDRGHLGGPYEEQENHGDREGRGNHDEASCQAHRRIEESAHYGRKDSGSLPNRGEEGDPIHQVFAG